MLPLPALVIYFVSVERRRVTQVSRGGRTINVPFRECPTANDTILMILRPRSRVVVRLSRQSAAKHLLARRTGRRTAGYLDAAYGIEGRHVVCDHIDKILGFALADLKIAADPMVRPAPIYLEI